MPCQRARGINSLKAKRFLTQGVRERLCGTGTKCPPRQKLPGKFTCR
jgi:hypothetical protein